MRKLLLLVVLMAVAGSIWSLLSSVTKRVSQSPSLSPSPTVLGTPSTPPEDSIDITYNDSLSRIAWFSVPDITSLTLHPNFTEKKTSREFMDQEKCTHVVNGGFYTENNKPTGLFVSDRVVLRGWLANNLLNGVLSINTFDTPRITRVIPKDKLVIAVQTGPLLIENDRIQKLSLKNDKAARRMVAAVTGENTLYFLALYNPDSLYTGPRLEDMPGLLSQFEKESGIDFADAVNLDGGSASAYLTDNLTISEYSPVGSFFCIKK